jgi:putative sterol carrier protein
MSDVTVQQLMERMPKAFIPEKAVGVDAVVQYKLTGDGGGDWIITIKDGACAVQPGTTPTPAMTLAADATDYRDMITGTLNPMMAFMQGKIKLSGDLNLAMKLMNFFKL